MLVGKHIKMDFMKSLKDGAELSLKIIVSLKWRF